MATDSELQEKYKKLLPHLDEKSARLYLASEAQSMRRGGKVKVSKLASVSRVRLNKGIKELDAEPLGLGMGKSERIRKPGGGRKTHKNSQSGLTEALEKIVNPHTLGDPMNPLLWAGKRLRNIEKELKRQGYSIGHVTIGEVLKSIGYSLRPTRRLTKEAIM